MLLLRQMDGALREREKRDRTQVQHKNQ
jgi:hypothetical protein